MMTQTLRAASSGQRLYPSADGRASRCAIAPLEGEAWSRQNRRTNRLRFAPAFVRANLRLIRRTVRWLS